MEPTDNKQKTLFGKPIIEVDMPPLDIKFGHLNRVRYPIKVRLITENGEKEYIFPSPYITPYLYWGDIS